MQPGTTYMSQTPLATWDRSPARGPTMSRIPLTLLIALALTTPLFATTAEGSNAGLLNACERSGNPVVCEKAGIIPGSTVGPGETRTYQGKAYYATGTTTVGPGGTMRIIDARISFGAGSDGIIVQSGGQLEIRNSTLEEGTATNYTIIAQAGSILTIVQSRIVEGEGVKVATELTTFHNNTLERIPLALHLTDVSVTIRDSSFFNNTVAVNQTGGSPQLQSNLFSGGLTCVQDWRSNPTINANVFRGCHTGIWHEQSESTLTNNDMEDQVVPPGIGIAVIDTQSPVIEGNNIRNYGTGILVKNARAYIRNNSVHDNVYHGIQVETNSLAMDIQGNDVYGNGWWGIWVRNATDVSVRNNVVHNNGGGGITALNTVNTPISGNTVHHNGLWGILIGGSPSAQVTNNGLHNNTYGLGVDSSPGILLEGNNVAATNNVGITLGISSHNATLRANTVTGSTNAGFYVAGNDSLLEDNVATGNSDAGIVLRWANRTTLRGGDVSNNGASGIAVQYASGVLVEDVTSTLNARGMEVRFSDGIFRDVTVENNNIDGVWFDASGMPPGMPVSQFEHLIARNNGGDGFKNQVANKVFARNSWFENNAGAGVRNLGATNIDFTNNYWGSPLGPTTPNGPPAGDEVVGPVDYAPFLVAAP